jgi:hypothetical protein
MQMSDNRPIGSKEEMMGFLKKYSAAENAFRAP